MRIRCAKCATFVKTIEVERDIRDRSHVIVAHCHGEIDEMRIPYNDTASWTLADRLQWERVFRGEIEGIAFQEKTSLPAPVPALEYQPLSTTGGQEISHEESDHDAAR